MPKFYITNGLGIELIANARDEPTVFACLATLNRHVGTKFDLLQSYEDDAGATVWLAHDDVKGWMQTTIETILGSIGIDIADDAPLGILQTKYDAALEHIEDLESKLTSISDAMQTHNRAFNRAWEDMMSNLDSDKLLEAAFEDVDPDFTPFSQIHD